jgi:hydrogenase-4 component B
MAIGFFMTGVLLMLGSGVPGLPMGRTSDRGEKFFVILIVLGSLCGILGTLLSLAQADSAALDLPWSLPGAAFSLAIDPLSAVFLFPLFFVAPLGAIYGLGYWPQREHPNNGRKLRLFYGVISASMVLLLCARNGLLFLFAWEAMALSGFFLITTEDDQSDTRRAGLIYLAATHTGTIALFALFALLESISGSFQFPPAASLAAGGAASAIFFLGLFGFGLKAGLMPLHIWLPGAHAAAPSHASALLSGLMIKTGIYGLVRLTSFYAEIPPSWGILVLALGAISGIFGVALAIAQHDIKRLLAYHSVENIGIITLGLGIALIGRSYHQPMLVLLGISGALLHTVNHGLFKSLLFYGAGAVIHATGSRQIDGMGGLLRRMKWTGICFLGGAVAICGLPPFNGFVSEWLIYQGALHSLSGSVSASQLALLAAPALALIGGLALACFVKVFGLIFLGEPRQEAAARAHPAPAAMRLPMLVLLLACAWIGLCPWSVAPLLQRAATVWSPSLAPLTLSAPLAALPMIGLLAWSLLLLITVVWFWIARRSRKAPRDTSTWGCGYLAPTPRMQYSASSFGDFIVGLFRVGLMTERHGEPVAGPFPKPSSFSSHTPDAVLDGALLPAAGGIAWLCNRLRRFIQNGHTSFYLLYVALTLIVLFALIP